jgi:hypothetical protein
VRRAALAVAAARAAATDYSWDAAAERHRAVYDMLTRS